MLDGGDRNPGTVGDLGVELSLHHGGRQSGHAIVTIGDVGADENHAGVYGRRFQGDARQLAAMDADARARRRPGDRNSSTIPRDERPRTDASIAISSFVPDAATPQDNCCFGLFRLICN